MSEATVIDLSAKVRELEQKLEAANHEKAKKSARKSQEWLGKAQEKYGYLVGLDPRQPTDPENWHSSVVAVCSCEFCGQEFRRQPCDVHTAQVEGKGCCPTCRKAMKKTTRRESVKALEQQLADLKAQLEAQDNEERVAANQ